MSSQSGGLEEALRAGNQIHTLNMSISVQINFYPLYDGQYNQSTTSQLTGPWEVEAPTQ